jgi:hypothetical protein
MKVRFTPLRFLTRGFGGPAAAIIAAGLLTFPIIINDIRRALGSTDKSHDEFGFVDEFEVYKITAMLAMINERPLNNVLYNKMTKMIFERKIDVSVNLLENASKKSDPFKIVIGEYTVKRGFDE